MILSFWTHVWANSVDPDQTARRSSLIRVYAVCHSFCTFWTHLYIIKAPCSNFRMITAIFWGVWIFRIFMVISRMHACMHLWQVRCQWYIIIMSWNWQLFTQAQSDQALILREYKLLLIVQSATTQLERGSVSICGPCCTNVSFRQPKLQVTGAASPHAVVWYWFWCLLAELLATNLACETKYNSRDRYYWCYFRYHIIWIWRNWVKNRIWQFLKVIPETIDL